MQYVQNGKELVFNKKSVRIICSRFNNVHFFEQTNMLLDRFQFLYYVWLTRKRYNWFVRRENVYIHAFSLSLSHSVFEVRFVAVWFRFSFELREINRLDFEWQLGWSLCPVRPWSHAFWSEHVKRWDHCPDPNHVQRFGLCPTVGSSNRHIELSLNYLMYFWLECLQLGERKSNQFLW